MNFPEQSVDKTRPNRLLCIPAKSYDATASELAVYKKKEEEKRYFSREKLNEQTRHSSDREQLRKAMAFIDACGLRSDYDKFRSNSTTRKSVLE